MSPLRRLVVLRHAKFARPEGVPDHDRPLGPRGLRASTRRTTRTFSMSYAKCPPITRRCC